MYLRVNYWVLIFLEYFASYSVCTTVTWGARRCLKSVDEVGSTFVYKNPFGVLATSRAITKADFPANFTIFHSRISTIQPAWEVCATSVCWHTCRWHFCSCSSHKTIPSLRELAVTQLWSGRCCITYLSIGITQVIIMIARISYKVKWQLQ